jgi:hypothetical protein
MNIISSKLFKDSFPNFDKIQDLMVCFLVKLNCYVYKHLLINLFF